MGDERTPTIEGVTVAQRLASIRGHIDAAVRRRGPGAAVRLLAVSKRQPPSAIEAALSAGQRDFGENYAQELRDKRTQIDTGRAQWHFIGALQSNKVRHVLGCALIHTVDRPSLVAALDARAQRDGVEQAVLVQVNIAQDARKSGVRVGEVEALLDRFAETRRIRCCGLMTIPPAADPGATRHHFAGLRRLAERLDKTVRPRVALRELSMGMTGDFTVAIEEGATIVRVGTGVFGARATV